MMVISETEEVGSIGTHSVYDLNLAEACLMWASVMSGIFSLFRLERYNKTIILEQQCLLL